MCSRGTLNLCTHRFHWTFSRWLHRKLFDLYYIDLDCRPEESNQQALQKYKLVNLKYCPYRWIIDDGASNLTTSYSTYEQVPWHRKSGINHVFAIIGLLFFPPLVWWVAYLRLSGDIYRNERVRPHGQFDKWGRGSKVFAYAILVLHAIASVVLFLRYLISFGEVA